MRFILLAAVAAFSLSFHSLVFARHVAGPLTLSLEEAILLGVRSNPNVKSTQLNLVLSKFSVFVQQWQFQPHYSLSMNGALGYIRNPGQKNSRNNQYNLQPSISLLTPIGTQLTLSADNPSTTNYNPGLSFTIAQPLMRGFGKPVVEASLKNACDSEFISRLNFEGLLRSTISAIISAYLDVVTAEQTVKISEEALKRAENSVKQTKDFIKAGRKAGNELITVRATLESARGQLENDKNNLIQSRYALLAAIGLDPNSDIRFTTLNLKSLLNKYHLPDREHLQERVLANDIQYQVDQITLNGSLKRALLVAEDNTRWQLNLTASVTTGKGTGGGESAGINSIFNGQNLGKNAGFTLNIPINDQINKQAVLGAKVAIKQASYALLKSKWEKETSAINNWNLVHAKKRALGFAESAKILQAKTYDLNYQKYLHGLIDSLELQTAQLQYIQAQQSFLSAQIDYLKALVTMDALIGNTLKTWHISTRQL